MLSGSWQYFTRPSAMYSLHVTCVLCIVLWIYYAETFVCFSLGNSTIFHDSFREHFFFPHPCGDIFCSFLLFLYLRTSHRLCTQNSLWSNPVFRISLYGDPLFSLFCFVLGLYKVVNMKARIRIGYVGVLLLLFYYSLF